MAVSVQGWCTTHRVGGCGRIPDSPCIAHLFPMGEPEDYQPTGEQG